jgi:hypothetical protein
MDDRCAAITLKGTQCKFAHADGMVYCKMHWDKCLDFIKGYHDICDELWNEKCTMDMTIAELDNIIRLSSMCEYARIRYSNNCVGGSQDYGHKGAILKMQGLKNKCKIIKTRKYAGIKFGTIKPDEKEQYKNYEKHQRILKKYEDDENEMNQLIEKPLTKVRKMK